MKDFHKWMAEQAGNIEDGSTINNHKDTPEIVCDEHNITDEPQNSIYTPCEDDPRRYPDGIVAGPTGSSGGGITGGVTLTKPIGSHTCHYGALSTPGSMKDVIVKNATLFRVYPTDLQIRAAFADINHSTVFLDVFDVIGWVESFEGSGELKDLIPTLLNDEWEKARSKDECLAWWKKLYAGIADGTIK